MTARLDQSEVERAEDKKKFESKSIDLRTKLDRAFKQLTANDSTAAELIELRK